MRLLSCRQLLGTFLVFSLSYSLALSSATAQAPKDAPSETVTSKADGLPIHFTYIPADRSKIDGALEDVPVVILIHGGSGDRLLWVKKPTNSNSRKPMTEILRNEGYAVVAVDMRGHGETGFPDGQKTLENTDYAKMVGDLDAVKDFLLSEHQKKQLNVNKMGIVAADTFTPVALAFAAYDWQKPDYDDAPVPSRRTPRGRDVRALALLSPANQSGTLKAMPSVAFLKNPRIEMGIFIGVGTEDPADKKTASKFAKQFKTDRDDADNSVLQQYETRSRGTDLIGQPTLRTELHLFVFLKKSLKDLDIPWRNRMNRALR